MSDASARCHAQAVRYGLSPSRGEPKGYAPDRRSLERGTRGGLPGLSTRAAQAEHSGNYTGPVGHGTAAPVRKPDHTTVRHWCRRVSLRRRRILWMESRRRRGPGGGPIAFDCARVFAVAISRGRGRGHSGRRPRDWPRARSLACRPGANTRRLCPCAPPPSGAGRVLRARRPENPVRARRRPRSAAAGVWT